MSFVQLSHSIELIHWIDASFEFITDGGAQVAKPLHHLLEFLLGLCVLPSPLPLVLVVAVYAVQVHSIHRSHGALLRSRRVPLCCHYSSGLRRRNSLPLLRRWPFSLFCFALPLRLVSGDHDLDRFVRIALELLAGAVLLLDVEVTRLAGTIIGVDAVPSVSDIKVACLCPVTLRCPILVLQLLVLLLRWHRRRVGRRRQDPIQSTSK